MQMSLSRQKRETVKHYILERIEAGHKDVVNKAVVPINANERVLKMIAHVSKTK